MSDPHFIGDVGREMWTLRERRTDPDAMRKAHTLVSIEVVSPDSCRTEIIATTKYDHDIPYGKRTAARLRLIHAAPRLMHSLRRVLFALRPGADEELHYACEDARAALVAAGDSGAWPPPAEELPAPASSQFPPIGAHVDRPERPPAGAPRASVVDPEPGRITIEIDAADTRYLRTLARAHFVAPRDNGDGGDDQGEESLIAEALRAAAGRIMLRHAESLVGELCDSAGAEWITRDRIARETKGGAS